jgi:hypothetical protein
VCAHCKQKSDGVMLSIDGVAIYHARCAPTPVRVMALRALGKQVGTS